MNDGPNPTALATAERPKLAPVIDTGEFAQLLDSDRFAQVQRVAKLFSESDLVPEVFQGKPANCAVALQMAFRMRIDPMMLMQNMYIVHGRPGIEAKLAIALMNQRGPFEGPIQWLVEGDGDERSWTAFATHSSTGEKCSATVTWAIVKAEGWESKTGSKWKTMPDLMGRYRSAMFLGRLYCPEVLLGLPTDDELRDVGPRTVPGERIDITPIPMPSAKEQTPALPAQDQAQHGAPATPAAKVRTKPQDAPQAPESSAGDPNAGMPETTSGESNAERDPPFELDGAAKRVDMGPKLTDPQKTMLLSIAKRKGLSGAQLDERLVEKLSMGLDELPAAMIGDATAMLQAIADAKK